MGPSFIEGQRVAILALGSLAMALASKDVHGLMHPRGTLQPAANSSLVSGWSYIGCYTDPGPRTLPSAMYQDNTAMNGTSCVEYCSSQKYIYAGTEYASQCFCANAIGSGGVLDGSGNCSMACTGNPNEACGAGNFLTVYFANKAPPPGPQVNPGPPGWQSFGCYTDSGNPRALANGVNVPGGGNNMTVDLCTAACQGSGYTLAGVEYASQCFCDNYLEGGATSATTTDCNMPCNGNASEYCGGPNRLNLYAAGTVTPTASPTPTAVPVSVPAGWKSLGCYSDNVNGNRGLVYGANVVGGSNNMTTANCIAACNAAGYTIAGTEYAGECWCDNKFENQMAPVTDGRCNMACKGNSAQICGGANGLSVYQFAGWYPLGCWEDNVSGGRALPNGENVVGGSSNMTNSNCIAACGAAGYVLAGTEYSGECWCGNSIQNGGTPATDGRCNMACNGDATQTCGGPNGLTLWEYNSTKLATPPPGTTATTGATTATSPSTPTSSPTGGLNATAILPYKYQGCWTDASSNGRTLSNQYSSNSMTVESCVAYCSGQNYSIAGVEYSTQCFCDNYFRNSPSLVPDSQCNMACGGNSVENCGAGGRLSVYSNGTAQNYSAPTPQTTGLPANWVYKGCLADNVNNVRSLPYLSIFPTNNSNSQCISLCQAFGYNAAGTEYGYQCFCGDVQNTIDAGATLIANSTCNDICANDTSLGTGGHLCGGGNALSYYVYESTPLYEWDFATGSDAGAYEFLIGGVVIPLLTTPVRNGKVTFLEKFGTGPPNSTGAYELDLALMDNFTAAWRPMHVKTDIFCSASITLPDKVGRQINVGGWSGVSTEGIRLYWPDGSPGVWGTNDWEENPSEVQLLVGRWYPSAMTLANGSILVVGGEIGSNSAPVPSIEVLPSPSGEVLFCEYLNLTDPLNLYPFLVTLPSGGIFIGYYNQARVLDPVSLQTRKLLPNMPGAVNRPDAGRTYPLEGTAVIMPQHAPYTDYLTVLICGGSNTGAAVALDNCVSIQPDAPNATWTLERMPSKRVIPCMCALPDGTYLIMNGAYQGVAGFGLAVGPNLNAVLYDPRKPVNSRMTVMANTTVARLYHSESVLMDDGRVLVSGSDPEDGVNPQEYRNEVFVPPYLLKGGPRPAFNMTNIDFAYGQSLPFTITAPGSGAPYTVSFMGAVSSTHGNSMGQRTLFPAVSCSGTSCSVTAPPNANIAPPSWFQMFVLDADMVPSNAKWVRIGGDPAELGNWPPFDDFTKPGLGPAVPLY